jgi:hypothetical protein
MKKKRYCRSLFFDILYTAEYRCDKVFNILFVYDRNRSLKMKYFNFERLYLTAVCIFSVEFNYLEKNCLKINQYFVQYKSL